MEMDRRPRAANATSSPAHNRPTMDSRQPTKERLLQGNLEENHRKENKGWRLDKKTALPTGNREKPYGVLWSRLTCIDARRGRTRWIWFSTILKFFHFFYHANTLWGAQDNAVIEWNWQLCKIRIILHRFYLATSKSAGLVNRRTLPFVLHVYKYFLRV